MQSRSHPIPDAEYDFNYIKDFVSCDMRIYLYELMFLGFKRQGIVFPEDLDKLVNQIFDERTRFEKLLWLHNLEYHFSTYLKDAKTICGNKMVHTFFDPSRYLIPEDVKDYQLYDFIFNTIMIISEAYCEGSTTPKIEII